MRYCDVRLNGKKYRGVEIDEYRPNFTGEIPTLTDGFQKDNGYLTSDDGSTYWFEFEPLTWRVLDAEDGFIVCDTIIDSQPYNNYVLKSGGEYYSNSDATQFANDYYNSFIRRWLNDNFRLTAFTDEQEANVIGTNLNNDAFSSSYSQYDSAASSDKIFLLSWADVTKSSYGFSPSYSKNDLARRAQGSDYAKCQGLKVDDSFHFNGYSYWWLRTPGSASFNPCEVGYDGYCYSNSELANNTSVGVRPACRLAELKSDTALESEKKYETVEFGNYPQSLVTDAATISELNSMDTPWHSYGYYSGTGNYSDGKMSAKSYMFYRDAMTGGKKYRGVYFTAYRPGNTGLTSPQDGGDQAANGYFVRQSEEDVYWFEYEPLTWRVLDPDTGLVVCEDIIDAQAYNNFLLTSDGECYGNSGKTYSPNDYYNSSLRKWLNENFYNTAFNDVQKSNIATTTLDNSAFSSSYSQFDSAASTDKIFLLSWDEVTNTSYGFSQLYYRTDPARRAQGTDYAKCQGLSVDNSFAYAGNSNWWLRTPGKTSYYPCEVGLNGYCYPDGDLANAASNGVRPACRLIDLTSDTDLGYVQYGTYPQRLVTDNSVISALNANNTPWISYGFYSGSGSYSDGQMAAGDFMKYRDVMLNGKKYRGVYFTEYRPRLAGLASSEANSYQDENGYTVNTPDTAYWFEYQPLMWRVLDSSTGLILCETLVDSQAYNSFVMNNGGTYYGDSDNEHHASDYYYSDIREWLNEDFYLTAFTAAQQANIVETELDNSAYLPAYSQYGSAASSDKIFMLSRAEAVKADYGYASSYMTSDPARVAYGTDYAECLGLYRYNNLAGAAAWWLRSPGSSAANSSRVDATGAIGVADVSYTAQGIRPACVLAELKSDYALAGIIFRDVEDIRAGETKTASVAAGQQTYFRFIPEVSGYYTFASSSSSDTYGYLYDEDRLLITKDDDSGVSSNFSISMSFIKGQVYYFGCSYYSKTASGSFDVSLTLDSVLEPLIAVEGTDTVIDSLNGLIYGVSPLMTDPTLYFTAIEGYTCEGTASLDEPGVEPIYGTGSRFVVSDDTGVVVAEYTLILFGDVDGDGKYDAFDAFLLRLINAQALDISTLDVVSRMAADANRDGVINDADADLLERAGLLLAEVEQGVYIAPDIIGLSSGDGVTLIDQSLAPNYKAFGLKAPVTAEAADVSVAAGTVDTLSLDFTSFFARLVDFFQTIFNFLKSVFAR